MGKISTLKRIIISLLVMAFLSPALAQEKPEIFVQMGHPRGVYYVSFSNDNRFVLSGDGMTIKIWDFETGREIKTLIDSYSKFMSPKFPLFMPDGRHIVFDCLDSINILDITTNRVVKSLRHPSRITNSMAISPDGRYLAVGIRVGARNEIELWDLTTGRLARTFYGHADQVMSVTFSPDGCYILSGGWEDPIKMSNVALGRLKKDVLWNDILKIWDVSTGRLIRTFKGHKANVESVALSADGRYAFSSSMDGVIKIWDIKTGENIKSIEIKGLFGAATLSPDGRYALANGTDKTINFIDINRGVAIKTSKIYTDNSKFSFNNNGRYAASFINNSNEIKIWNIDMILSELTINGELDEIKSGKILRGNVEPVEEVSISEDGEKAYFKHKKNVSVWNLDVAKQERITNVYARSFYATGPYKRIPYGTIATNYSMGSGVITTYDFSASKIRIIAEFIAFTDGEWIVITPEGYYNASPNGDKYLNVRIGNNVYGIDNYREQFFRPDLVKLALSGGSLKGFKTLADVKQPPVVEIVDTPSEVSGNEVKVTVRLTDQGGGIGDVRLYLNGTSILLDSARGVKITPKSGEKTVYKAYTIRLLEGENIIKAIAFNAEGSMASNPAIHRVISLAKAYKKPSMYAIVIGINEYKNPKLELKYAVADARLFAETLKNIATPLFENVNITLLTTKEETTKQNIKKTLESMKNLRPDDVFVFYVASHGTVDEGEYFLITSNVGSVSTFRLKEDALTQAELKELIANVPTTKKMIIIDTCNAGKLGEALQVAMMTRGMNEETAMKILSSAVGSTIISASTGLQEAMEGYEGHGLFTYVLAEGMKGRADLDRDGFVKTFELVTYVDNEVPVLAEKVFKRAQYPTAQPTGQAFPVGKVR